MATYKGTPGDDVIDGMREAASSDQIDGLEGDDVVALGATQTFISGIGNDTITGSGMSQYGLWFVQERPSVDLQQGFALDGFGGRDTISGISVVHLSEIGGAVIGTDRNEDVFLFGGNNEIDLGGGSDTATYWQKSSGDYSMSVITGGIQILNMATGSIDVLKGVETIRFADREIDTAYFSAPLKSSYQYTAHSFRETQMAPGYTYAGVYSPPNLVSWLPQGGGLIDLDNDGRLDPVVPMNKGYATGIDTRTAFIALTGATGKLIYDASINAEMPVTAGSRRAGYIDLHGGKTAMVTVGHDTGDGKLTDLTILAQGLSEFDMNARVPTLPSALSAREHAVNAHAMATGDINGDGLDDILVGEWGGAGTYALMQQQDASYRIERQPIYSNITNAWPLQNTSAAQKFNILVDLGLVDVNGDGYDDMIAGWGHGSTKSYVFVNNKGSYSDAEKNELPVSVYGIDNQLHLKTMPADFDLDGDIDLAILWSRFEPYYGGNYIQILSNDGTGKFNDITMDAVDNPLRDAFGARLQWTDYWQIVDVNNDGAMDIVGHRTGTSTVPVVYLNDGSGRFSVVEVKSDVIGGRPIAWSDFDGDGRLEYVAFYSSWEDATGTSSINRFDVHELAQALGTGPRFVDTADVGAPGFNENYYLNQYHDVRTAVDSGEFSSGLAHYLSKGKAEGRFGFSPNIQVHGSLVDDVIRLREGAETVQAYDGNDIVQGYAGNDTIDGGAGLDTAIFSSLRSQFSFSRGDGKCTVADTTSSEGVDTLINVERLRFSDKALALDIDGTAGRAYRLYQAAFDRQPDLPGLGWQIKAMDDGASLIQLAQNFMTSPEFTALYGTNPSTVNFVNLLYSNVLHRAPQKAESDFWINILDRGTPVYQTRAEVLMNFSESAENKAQVIGLIQNGIEYQYFA